jgi:hypothetical protein
VSEGDYELTSVPVVSPALLSWVKTFLLKETSFLSVFDFLQLFVGVALLLALKSKCGICSSKTWYYDKDKN